jgi:hypothetical protein
MWINCVYDATDSPSFHAVSRTFKYCDFETYLEINSIQVLLGNFGFLERLDRFL